MKLTFMIQRVLHVRINTLSVMFCGQFECILRIAGAQTTDSAVAQHRGNGDTSNHWAGLNFEPPPT